MKNKVAFLICTNDDQYMGECRYYIERLTVPEGYEIEILTNEGAESMCSGYNELMRASDATYKVYLHQDTFILNKEFINHIIRIFETDETIGMIGMVGYEKISDSGVMWKSTKRLGAVPMYGACKRYKDADFDKFDLEDVRYEEVAVIDGFLMATCIDLPWDETTFDGWDFYDTDQSFNFREKGYKVVVPVQDKPWCVHDDGEYQTLWNYNRFREKFLNKYCGSELIKDSEKLSETEKEKILNSVEANEKNAEINKSIIASMEKEFEMSIKSGDSNHIGRILELIKNNDFILSGKSSKIIRMLGAFGYLSGIGDITGFIETYNELIFALRRIEITGDFSLLKKLVKNNIQPGAAVSILEKEYFERDEYICDGIATANGLFLDDISRLKWLMTLGGKYPTETICSETAALLLDYNEFAEALKWLERIESPSAEISAIISELRNAIG